MDRLICGDCITEMAKLADNSIDSIVTDPPYELGFMGKGWDKSGIAYNVEMWKECLRVLKPGGHLLSFGGSRTYHRMACAIEDAGWEIRDQIMWIYGSGFPKSHNLKGEWQGWGTALKPAHEPICVARKPLSEKTVADNVMRWGTGAINVDGCRVGATLDDQRTQLRANTKGAGRYVQTNDTAYSFGPANTDHDPSKGRWPANLIHDGSDEVVGLFPNSKSTGGISSNTQPLHMSREAGNLHPISERANAGGLGDSGSAARFFYCAKASRAEREMGLEGMEAKPKAVHIRQSEGRQLAGQMESLPAKNHHPTVKPLALMRYLVRLVTPPNGLVLDPFIGSGTTGMACKAEGFEFIGIDNNSEYVEIAERRISAVSRQMEIPR